MQIEIKLAKKFIATGKTLAVAESCTGGLVSHRITNISGSSAYFLGGVIAYSNEVKISIFKVPRKTIEKYGAVSRETALAMARGARRVFKSDIAAAVTGIAGPGGGTGAKPVGLAYISVVSGKKEKTVGVFFKGDRAALKKQFAEIVLETVVKCI